MGIRGLMHDKYSEMHDVYFHYFDVYIDIFEGGGF